MSRSWLYIMGLLFLSGFLANMLGNAPWIVIGLDLAVLALSYRILQQDPF